MAGSKMTSLEGQIALIAGGASGLGRAVARRFLAEGASVAILDRSDEKLVALKEPDVLGASPERILLIRGDVRSHEDCRSALAQVEHSFGVLDALVMTTGIVDYVASFRSYRTEDFMPAFEEVMAVNVGGPVTLALLAARLLTESRGSITFTLSTSAFHAPASGPVYGMSKAALVMAVKQLALDLAPEVRVNGVVPGAVTDTDIRGPEALDQGTQVTSLADPDVAAGMARRNLLGLAPRGEDYAGLYALLASRTDAAVATGSVISWDAGTGLTGHGHLMARRQTDGGA